MNKYDTVPQSYSAFRGRLKLDYGTTGSFDTIRNRLQKRNLIQIYKNNDNKKIIKLTNKGERVRRRLNLLLQTIKGAKPLDEIKHKYTTKIKEEI